jgi:hypothetical protein
MISPLPYLERAAMILRAGCKAVDELKGLSTLGGPPGGGSGPPPCVKAAPGASEQVKLCLSQACVAMLASYLACNGDEACQIRVLGVYDEAVQACQTPGTTPGTNPGTTST